VRRRLLNLLTALSLLLCVAGCGTTMRRPTVSLASVSERDGSEGEAVLAFTVSLKNANGFPVTFNPAYKTSADLSGRTIPHRVAPADGNDFPPDLKPGERRLWTFNVAVPWEVVREARRDRGKSVPLRLRGVVLLLGLRLHAVDVHVRDADARVPPVSV
jgi:hypothetical protein